MKKILLTGATGFIGSHIAEYFNSQGEDITCLVRPNSKKDFLNSLNIKTIEGELRNLNELEEKLKNFNFIIHTAGKVCDWGKYSDFEASNITNTLNLLKASIENGIRDFIITGTNSCFGEESSSKIKNENCEYNSHYNYFPGRIFPSAMNFYRDSKAISIEKAKNLAFKEQINLTVIHPVFVYGEREFSSGFYEYLKSVSSGIKIFPGSLKNKFHTIYARNLAKIYHLAYKKVLKGVNEFIAGDKTAEYQHVIYEKFCEYAGFKPPFLMPKEILYMPGLLMELIYTILRTEKPPVLTRARVNMFYDNIEYSTEKLINEFDYTPDFDFDEGIERTVKWYKANNYL